MKKTLLLWLIPFIMLSQIEERKYCGTSQLMQEVLKDSEKKQILDQLDIFTKEFINNNNNYRQGQSYIIPVVVHVIHNYGSENISYEQIDNGILRINEDFNTENDDIEAVISEFQNIIGNVNMRFRLATKDPDGNCTYGVTRTGSSLTQGGSIQEIMSLVNWPSDQYVNIYIMESFNESMSSSAAFATKPGMGNEYGDYIFCRHDYFGDWNTNSDTGPTGNNWARHTMPHEMGHFFNLDHPWGNTAEPGIEDNCGYDDNVDDTPNTIGTSGNIVGCPLDQTTCGSLDNVQNIMDYSACAHMFTQGQVDRMIAAANSYAGDRMSLWQEENLIATGTDDETVNFILPSQNPYLTCAPIPDFTSEINIVCLGSQIWLNNHTYNYRDSDIDYLWSLPGATPSESSEEYPYAQYNEPGTYDVSLTACNGSFCETLTMENYITVLSQTDLTESNLLQDFEDSDFPNMANEIWWLQEDNEQQNWEITNLASSEGSYSIRINSQNYEERSSHSFVTPKIDLSALSTSGSDPLQVCFDYAYAKRLPYTWVDWDWNNYIYGDAYSAHHDDFIVSFKNCDSSNWTERPRLSTRPGLAGSYLALQDYLFTTSDLYSEEFIPQPDEWKQHCITIQQLAGNEDAILKFEFVGGGNNIVYENFGGSCPNELYTDIGGHWLYIDNILIGLSSQIGDMSPNTGCDGQYDECGICNGDGPELYYGCDGLCLADIDCDGVCDEFDNCPWIYNPNQQDSDDDNLGDDCDATPLSVEQFSNSKSLIKMIDILGRETNSNKGFKLKVYDDGSIEKEYLVD